MILSVTQMTDIFDQQTILVTGAAGFIGFHLAQRFLVDGFTVVGLDNFNSYYDPSLKEARWSQLEKYTGFRPVRGDIRDADLLAHLFDHYNPNTVYHLAAQAGVRYSIEAPQAYVDSNITGFLSVLEACRRFTVHHLIYASSSSVYGANQKIPFAVTDSVDHPVSLYAATKKSNELMAHSYSSLFGIPVTGLRFFTVYGPWGRPDMALFSFLQKMKAGKPIDIYNHGNMRRDFTYIDDIVESMVRLAPLVPVKSPMIDRTQLTPDKSFAPYALYNIGRSQPELLLDVIEILEKASGIEARKNFISMQPGDVPATYADVSSLEDAIKYSPQTSLAPGIKSFVNWYESFYET